jgi:hypothetical protein
MLQSTGKPDVLSIALFRAQFSTATGRGGCEASLEQPP